MSEITPAQPSAQRIGEIREGVRQQFPRAERVLKRTDPQPSSRQVINVAGELYRQQQEMIAKGDIDPMTGLLSDQGFNRRIKEEIARAQRNGDQIALLFFDMNGLKTTNDELGHAVGDARIKTAADILSNSFRPTDIVARKGEKADEFLVAIPVKDMDTVKDRYAQVNNVTQAVNQNWEGYPITLPAGVVRLDPNDIEGSIARADEAMYKAKEVSKITGQNALQFQTDLIPAA